MKNNSIAVIGLATLVFSSVAIGQTVSVRGARGCGEWIKDRQEEAQGRGTLYGQTWLIGFLSGMALESEKDFWGKPGVNSLDNESVYLWMDTYCRANPLMTITRGANILFIERNPTRREK